MKERIFKAYRFGVSLYLSRSVFLFVWLIPRQWCGYANSPSLFLFFFLQFHRVTSMKKKDKISEKKVEVRVRGARMVKGQC